MSEFTDLLLQVFGPTEALLFLGLVGANWVQTRHWDRRFDAVTDRLGRLEDAMMVTDGGEVEE